MAALRLRRHTAAIAGLAITVALAGLAARRGGGLAADTGFLSAAHPWVRLDREITEEFGFANPVVWVVAAPRDTIWRPERLRTVQELTAAALRIPGVVATDVISIASPNLRDLEVSEAGMRPKYLMTEVPTTPAELEVLRRRVEDDPNYRGTLVSLDGRAAMVVANFRPDADARAVGEAARALRAAHRDADTEVYVAGMPLIETMHLPFDARTLGVAALALLAAVMVLCAGLGTRAGLACILAALLAAVWTASGVVAAGLAQLPWAAYALPYAALLGGSAAAVPRERLGWRRRLTLAAALAAAFACMALALDPPARSFAIAGAAASGLALLASALCAPRHAADAAGASAGGAARLGAHGGLWRVVAVASVLGAAWALPQLRTSLALAGYGQRYLLGAEASDLRAIATYFPPPIALAVRVRGAPRFVTSPAVLRALDGVAVALRTDPSVTSAMSVADLVKLVNRAFNDNDPAFAVIPDDDGLIARYLTLAYSPGFRRFVDRSLARAAVWVYVGSDDRADLARVATRLQAELAAHPVPGAEVDLIGGDGAALLLMADMLRALLVAAGLWLAGAALLLALLWGPGAALRGGLAGMAAAAAMGGLCAWRDLPLDLVSAPLLVAVAAAATALAPLSAYAGAARCRAMGLALALAGGPGVLSTYAGAQVLGAALLALGLVALALPAGLRQSTLVSRRQILPQAAAAPAPGIQVPAE